MNQMMHTVQVSLSTSSDECRGFAGDFAGNQIFDEIFSDELIDPITQVISEELGNKMLDIVKAYYRSVTLPWKLSAWWNCSESHVIELKIT